MRETEKVVERLYDQLDAARRTEAELRAENERLRAERDLSERLLRSVQSIWAAGFVERINWFARRRHKRGQAQLDMAVALLSQPPDEAEVDRREHCRRCGNLTAIASDGLIPITWWRAPDDLWLRVTGEPHGDLLCPRCFTRAADAAGIPVRWSVEEDLPPDEAESTEGHAFMENCGRMEDADACWLCGRRKAEHPGWVDAPNEASPVEAQP